MDEREILTRFKAGTLGRDDAARLLTGARQARTDTAPPRPRADPPLTRTRPETAPRPTDPYARPPAAPPGDPYTQPPVQPPAATPAEPYAQPSVRPDADPPVPLEAEPSAEPYARPSAGPYAPPPGPWYAEPGAVPPPGRPAVEDRYAVVGIAGRYPLAPDLHAHWENLRTGRDTSRAVPVTRPGLAPAPPGRRGHFLDDVAEFDPEFFGITPAEGALTDPQERLFLEVAWEALENAGCTGSRLDALTTPGGPPRALGVFVGASSHDYALLAAASWTDGRPAPAAGHGGLPGRLASALELTGPARAVDTAECSALTALHLAVGALRREECAAAVVGGVELLLHPSRIREDAGEGVGAVVLKPLRRALDDGDRVHAVIRDTADGRTARHRDRPADTRTHQRTDGAHETRESTARRIGSAGAATGIAALTAAVLQVRHGVLAPRDGRGAAAPWPRTCDDTGRELPRTATVEIAADDGCAARAVVEEHPAAEAPAGEEPGGDDGPFLLSAPTPAHLAATARRFADWLAGAADAGHPAGALPAGLARALRAGRAALPCRLALPASDAPGVIAALRRFADTGSAGEEARTADLRGGADPMDLGGLPQTRDYLTALWRAGHREQVTRLWLNGVDVDWTALEAASPGTAPAEPPPSVHLRRPLWLSTDGAGAPREPEPTG
ncbi:beta-ketoacyl synthase N-terminal-like domain-containing protein [Streptomyces sp. MA15]|uniref:beta-ketoacyl synthase N-terminal-like domain-containing protein n=1 Tax=Streptomyces sp. MA15 TaxID=3055061 RepID=UPI0025AF4F7A|nr:beta-ketoacyl synthase N-terminal-like domain-containing protein [Streptomyces sp. MA15]MDN3271660.1 beta-ketoacyl synthase N-terminal-like domain-containing protein [Streptomyces sp. MA15]